MVNENLKKLEIKKLREVLEREADQVLDLNKNRVKLDTGMRERLAEIDIHQDLLRTQVKQKSTQVKQKFISTERLVLWRTESAVNRTTFS